MSFDLARVIRPEVQAVRPYHAGPVAGSSRGVKLDANESPFSLGEALRGELAQELSAALAEVELHRYPDAEARDLRRALAGDLGVSPAQLLATNGSDEAIQMLLLAVASPDATVLSPVPTFVMYELGCRCLGLRFVGVALDDRFALDVPRTLEAVRAEQPRLVFLAWPNNPTGSLFDEAAVEGIVGACNGRDCHGLVVVDEAYVQYSGRTFLDRLDRYPNLVILRTLSKIGLAGIRLGMLVASPAVVAELNKVRLPYNVNSLSQAAARVVLRHGDVVRRLAATVVGERERLLRALERMPGLTVYPSDANFFLIRTARPDEEMLRELLERGILVRSLPHAPQLANCLRVTVGTAEENDAFLSALGAILGAGG